MTIQKSCERSAAKVMGIVNASLAVLVVICGIACFIVYGALRAKYPKLLFWPFGGPGIGCFFGGIAWCVIAGFTLKVLYTSTSRKAMIGWGIVNLLFVFPIPLFVIMIIIARTQCGENAPRPVPASTAVVTGPTKKSRR